jgi:hypothetical protein
MDQLRSLNGDSIIDEQKSSRASGRLRGIRGLTDSEPSVNINQKNKVVDASDEYSIPNQTESSQRV